MTKPYSFSCQCGKVVGKICLPKELAGYSPRECDCDFCTARGIKYLSDPEGVISIQSSSKLLKLKQGSNQAEFLTCSSCKDVIAASLNEEGKIIGALNSSLLEMSEELGTTVVVSPKLLSESEKVERWGGVWCSLSILN